MRQVHIFGGAFRVCHGAGLNVPSIVVAEMVDKRWNSPTDVDQFDAGHKPGPRSIVSWQHELVYIMCSRKDTSGNGSHWIREHFCYLATGSNFDIPLQFQSARAGILSGCWLRHFRLRQLFADADIQLEDGI